MQNARTKARRGDIKFAERLKCNFGNQLRELPQRKNRVLRNLQDKMERRHGTANSNSIVCETPAICLPNAIYSDRSAFNNVPKDFNISSPRVRPSFVSVVIYLSRIRILITEVRDGRRKRVTPVSFEAQLS